MPEIIGKPPESGLSSKHHDPRGSIWRRWDLHIHTPLSFTQQYGGDTPEVWDAFLADLEALPPEFKAIGINDYLFIDGYERVLRERQNGRLKNIDLILPVVELRLDKFGGTDSHLSRVNYHIIFSDELSPEEIRTQFLNLLRANYTLGGEDFNKAINPTTLAELGQKLIDTTPEQKRTGQSPLAMGFSHLNFPLSQIEQLLTNTTFTNRHLTAVGKTEWADVKWQQSAADKRTIIDRADFVFIAGQNPEHCRKNAAALAAERVNDRLLDCSDAHYPSSSQEKERIGNCFTWIKADTTFDGLRQVRSAPTERIYLGDLPPKLALLAQQPTKYISTLEIRRKPSAGIAERWFDNQVSFNPDLVAIIGNKGMGKSALTDVIAITSNADAAPERYGFLADKKFRDRKDNKARHFTATITWHSGDTLERGLDENVPAGTVPQVRYIPQNYFEDLCNETTDAAVLQRELRGVIFSNLPSAQRGRFGDLDELITSHTSEADRRIDDLRAELHTTNRDIVQLEHALSATKRKELEDALQQAEAALAAHDHNIPEVVAAPPQQNASPDLDSARQTRDALGERVRNEREKLQTLYADQATVANLTTRFRAIQEAVTKLRSAVAGDLSRLGITFESLLPATVTLEPLENLSNVLAAQVSSTELLLDGDGGLVAQHKTIQDRIKALQNELDAPARAYQQYLERQQQWGEQRAAIVGTAEASGSVEYLKARLTTERNLQTERLTLLETERLGLSRAIHEALSSITSFQATLYAPVAARLANHPVLRAQLNVNFISQLVDTGVAEQFTKRINRGRAGRFSEDHAMRDHITPFDVNVAADVEQLLTSTVALLHHNQQGEAGDIGDVQRQLRKDGTPEELYNFLFGLEYLSPQYALRINDRELSQLTPGERGSLLLVFYLVIDQDDRPLIIDQPEENLDNQSVFELLVPCISEAKQRRQIIIVTHNPNLAVVCNAEQVIWCKIAKDTDHAVTYETGGIENPAINKHLVDVLEGTWPAFSDRGSKYHESV